MTSDQAYRRPCGCLSAASSRLDLSFDLLHDCEKPPPLVPSYTRRSSDSSAQFSSTNSSSASSPLSAPSLVDCNDVPALTDLPPPRSPFISASNYPQSPNAKLHSAGLHTPPVFTLESPSLRPLLRYARKAFPTDVRSSGKVPNLDHRRTPSELEYFSAGRKSAPVSAAPSPILTAHKGNVSSGSSAKDDTIRLKKKSNRQSLPGCFTALTMPSPPTVQLTIDVHSGKPAAGSTVKAPRGIASPSLIFVGRSSPVSSSVGSDMFDDHASITPTSRLTTRLNALAREREHQLPIDSAASPATTSAISSLGIGSALDEAFLMENALTRGRSFRRRSDATSSEKETAMSLILDNDLVSSSSGEEEFDRGRTDRRLVTQRRASSPGLRDKRFLLEMSDMVSPVLSRTRRQTEGRPEEFILGRRAGRRESPARRPVDSDQDERRGRSRVR